MGGEERRGTFDDLTREIAGVLCKFNGEASVKHLFWSLLSYERERHPLAAHGVSPELVRDLSSLEVFASHDDAIVLCARVAQDLPRMGLEYLCRQLQRRFPRILVLLCAAREMQWQIVFPDESKKQYLRVLDLPGDEEGRDETARALAALSAVDPDDGSPVSWLDIVHRLEAFFPGPIPRLWEDETIGTYISTIRPRLERVEEFMHDIKRFPLLTRRQERGDDLGGDEVAPDGSGIEYRQWRLIVHNLRLVVHMAYEMPRRGMELEDLVQEGCAGLLVAANKFEPERGYRFSTYAYYWIMQRMKRALYENMNLIRWPEHIKAEIARARAAGNTRSMQPGWREVVPLTRKSRIMNDPWQDSDDPVEKVLAQERCDQIRKEVDALKPSERSVLFFRFGLSGNGEQTLEQVGQRMGITRARVCQIEDKALKRLKGRIIMNAYEFAPWARHARSA